MVCFDFRMTARPAGVGGGWHRATPRSAVWSILTVTPALATSCPAPPVYAPCRARPCLPSAWPRLRASAAQRDAGGSNYSDDAGPVTPTMLLAGTGNAG